MILVGILLAAGFLMAVLHWWSEGMMGAVDAVLVAVIFCGLIFGLFAARTAWERGIAAVPLAGAAAYMAWSFKTGSARSYYRGRARQYAGAIHADPRNLGARQKLAEMLYSLNELDRAIDELQVAVNMGAGFEYQHKLSRWTRERYKRDCPNPICRWCEAENPRGARTCSKCGSDLPYDSAISRWLMGGRSPGSRYVLVLLASAAVCIASVLTLPLKLALIPIALCASALIGWALVTSARQ